MKKGIVFVLLSIFALFARQKELPWNPIQIFARPNDVRVNMTDGEMWNWMSNFGAFGGELGQGDLGCTWPGGAAVNNYYLWNSYFTVAVVHEGTPYVTYHNYPSGEWSPSEGPDILYEGPGYSVHDVVVAWDDFNDNPRNSSGRHLGLKFIIRAMVWPHEPYNDFNIYWLKVYYDKTKSDFGTDFLDSLFISQWYDCDVSGIDQSDPHIDDLVHFDGWTNGEWKDKNFLFPEPEDKLTITPDSFWTEPDGINDHYFVWGDEKDEIVLDTTVAKKTYIPWLDDTVYVYILPRGMSYIYDGDNPAVPGEDTGEDGGAIGYNFGAWLYTPPSPADTYYYAGSDTMRYHRPFSHQWWNWESDPATDEAVYDYIRGTHSATKNYRYAPHPFDLGAAEFDYRFLNSVGPFKIHDKETLHFVWVAGVGQELSGGNDEFWGRGWLLGARQTMEKALQVYYAGSEFSDPFHPTPPNIDRHFYIPVPPVSPNLNYTATPEGIKLIWDDISERTPDPLKGVVDLVGYKVYRATHEPRGWNLLAQLPGPPFEHQYTDTTAVTGFPYYYAVTAYDDDSLESAQGNYLKDADGNPKYIEPLGEPKPDVKDVYVAPNPYLGSAPWLRATEVGDKIMFMNLPAKCRITIYTLDGDMVISMENTAGQGSLAWNLLSRQGLKVVSGVYIYKVEDDKGNYKIGKFVILR